MKITREKIRSIIIENKLEDAVTQILKHVGNVPVSGSFANGCYCCGTDKIISDDGYCNVCGAALLELANDR